MKLLLAVNSPQLENQVENLEEVSEVTRAYYRGAIPELFQDDSYDVLVLSAFLEGTEDLYHLVKTARYHNARVIFLAGSMERSDPLLNKIFHLGVYDIIFNPVTDELLKRIKSPSTFGEAADALEEPLMEEPVEKEKNKGKLVGVLGALQKDKSEEGGFLGILRTKKARGNEDKEQQETPPQENENEKQQEIQQEEQIPEKSAEEEQALEEKQNSEHEKGAVESEEEAAEQKDSPSGAILTSRAESTREGQPVHEDVESTLNQNSAGMGKTALSSRGGLLRRKAGGGDSQEETSPRGSGLEKSLGLEKSASTKQKEGSGLEKESREEQTKPPEKLIHQASKDSSAPRYLIKNTGGSLGSRLQGDENAVYSPEDAPSGKKEPVIAVWSPVPAGKTFLAVHLAVNIKGLIIDLDFGKRSVSTFLNLPSPGSMEEPRRFKKVRALYLTPGDGLSDYPDREALLAHPGPIVLDMPAVPADWHREVMEQADLVVFVVDPDYDRILKARECYVEDFLLVVNKNVKMRLPADPFPELLGADPVVRIGIYRRVYEAILAGETIRDDELNNACRYLYQKARSRLGRGVGSKA